MKAYNMKKRGEGTGEKGEFSALDLCAFTSEKTIFFTIFFLCLKHDTSVESSASAFAIIAKSVKRPLITLV